VDLNGLNKVDPEGITLHPTYILDKAFSKVDAVGSSTAMVAIRNQRTLHVANLGDSGFILIRFRNNEAYAALKSRE
jgi:serine/threonine protein phosphatase PrpC